TLLVEDLVLRDYLVQEQQVGRQRIDLIGGESPLIPDRHAAIDEIPYRRRVRRAPWQEWLPPPHWDVLALFLFPHWRPPTPACRAMAGDARLLLKDQCALLGGAAAGRKLISLSIDRDIHAAELFRGRRAPHAIGGRLRGRGAAQKSHTRGLYTREQHNRGQQDRDQPKRAHSSPSRPGRSSKA